jgi:hypothetical protein
MPEVVASSSSLIFGLIRLHVFSVYRCLRHTIRKAQQQPNKKKTCCASSKTSMKLRIIGLTLTVLAALTLAPSANAHGFHRGGHPVRIGRGGYGYGGFHRHHEHRFWRGREIFWEYVPGYGYTWAVIAPGGFFVPVSVDFE